jgi:hypothetical protein
MIPFTHDPDARVDYGVDWSDYLDEGESITEHEWITTGDDLTLTGESLAGAVHATFVEGGVLGRAYRITSRITTSAGRRDDQSITLIIKEH